jgi:hypothetical protein
MGAVPSSEQMKRWKNVFIPNEEDNLRRIRKTIQVQRDAQLGQSESQNNAKREAI